MMEIGMQNDVGVKRDKYDNKNGKKWEQQWEKEWKGMIIRMEWKWKRMESKWKGMQKNTLALKNPIFSLYCIEKLYLPSLSPQRKN